MRLRTTRHEKTREECWGVWCSVSGGVTGSRAAWMKEKGAIWTGTEEEAREKARAALASLGPYSGRHGARFAYSAQRYR